MGRQTSVALDDDDERTFLNFLRTQCDLQILGRHASSPEGLFLTDFPAHAAGDWIFYLWNPSFPWRPEYAQWGPDIHDSRLASHYYLINKSGAPLIEYCREMVDTRPTVVRGRIYWNTDFAVYRGLEYDTVAFGRWYDQVVRWLRKSGTRVEVTKGWYQYWLPGAWKLRCLTGDVDDDSEQSG